MFWSKSIVHPLRFQAKRQVFLQVPILSPPVLVSTATVANNSSSSNIVPARRTRLACAILEGKDKGSFDGYIDSLYCIL